MKITETIAVSSSSNKDSVSATLSFDDMDKLWYMFESPYKNSIASLIREYTSNGWDANVEAGVDEPVVVGLSPWTEDGAYFYVLDKGVGMSEEFIRENFSRYLYSPKSSNNNAIGAWGIGSKSGLSYSPIVEFESTQNGITTSFLLRKSEDSPVLDILSVGDEEKPEGTLVKIPVQLENDVTKFKIEIYNQLRFFPNVYFKELVKSYNDIITYQANTFKVSRCSAEGVNSIKGISLLVGPVAYSIDSAQLDPQIVHEIDMLSQGPDLDIGLILEIGDVDVTPSREDVKYNDKANVAINNALIAFKKEVEEVIQKNIKQISFTELFTNNMKGVTGILPHLNDSVMPANTLKSLLVYSNAPLLIPIENYLIKVDSEKDLKTFKNKLSEVFSMFCGISFKKGYRNPMSRHKIPLFSGSKILSRLIKEYENKGLSTDSLPYKSNHDLTYFLYARSLYYYSHSSTSSFQADLTHINNSTTFDFNNHLDKSNSRIHTILNEAGKFHNSSTNLGLYYWDKYNSISIVLKLVKSIISDNDITDITPKTSELGSYESFSWTYNCIQSVKKGAKEAIIDICTYSDKEITDLVENYKLRNKKAPKERASKADGKVYLRQFVANAYATDYRMDNNVYDIESLSEENRLPIITLNRPDLELVKSFNYSLKGISGIESNDSNTSTTFLGKKVLLVEPTKISLSVLKNLNNVFTLNEFIAKEVSFMDRFIIDLNYRYGHSLEDSFMYKNSYAEESVGLVIENLMVSSYTKSKLLHKHRLNNLFQISSSALIKVALLAIREASVTEKEAKLFTFLKEDLRRFIKIYRKEHKYSAMGISDIEETLLKFSLLHGRLPYFLNVSEKLKFYTKYPKFKCNGKK